MLVLTEQEAEYDLSPGLGGTQNEGNGSFVQGEYADQPPALYGPLLQPDKCGVWNDNPVLLIL